eukprot:TRINITY_DN2124_c0_g1_i13.p6 TRINITY_DN2124_c0_g1~~TRINITY_DN2124_c0_g1_i13.p6  ORF type:complete len:117 (+),score=4.86 TRINITY_DN2124_c0_g1_i13:888-1238(+)
MYIILQCSKNALKCGQVIKEGKPKQYLKLHKNSQQTQLPQENYCPHKIKSKISPKCQNILQILQLIAGIMRMGNCGCEALGNIISKHMCSQILALKLEVIKIKGKLRKNIRKQLRK